MCSYSVISDYYMNPGNWPNYYPARSPIDTMSGEQVRLLKEISLKLDRLDKSLKDRDCNDPSKAAFKRKLNKRIRETRLAGKGET
jgi:hypothetical protein